jgi:hypothetical protein
MRDIVDSPLVLFGFVSLFHIIGAAVLAGAVRGLWFGLREGELGGCQAYFTLVWAVMFGGLPFLFGVQFAGSEDGTILFLIGEILVWTTTFLVALLAQQAVRSILEPFLTTELLIILFGGSFLVAGVAVASLLTQEDREVGLLIGGVFAVVGAGTLGFGLWRLLKSTE